jgi:hypothetical protein
MSQATVTLALNASQFEAALKQATSKIDGFATKVGGAFSSSIISRLSGIAVGVVGVGAAFNTLQRSLSSGVALNSQLEQTKNSVATLLNQFDGNRFGGFNSRMAEAEKLLESLRKKGMYAEATFANLTNTFQMTSGSMFSAGIKDGENQIDLIVGVSQALAALGGDQANLASELNALTTGNVSQWHKVAKSIGLTGSEIKKLSADGTLYTTLMSKLGPILVDAEQGMDTFSSQTTILQENLDNLKTKLAEPLFEALKEGLKELNAQFKNNDFADALKDASRSLARLAKEGMGMLASVMEIMPAIIKFAGVIKNLLIPALLTLAASKVLASTKAQALNNTMMTLGSGGITSATRAWKTFQYNLIFTPTITGKVIQSFKLMFVSLKAGFTSIAATGKAAFTALATAAKVAAASIQAALLLVTFAFEKAMSWANAKNNTTDEQMDIGKESGKQFKANMERVSTIGSETEKDDFLKDLEDQRKAVIKKIADVATSDRSEENQNVLIEEYNRQLKAIDAVENSLGKVSAEKMRQNLLTREAAELAAKEKAAVEKLRETVKEAREGLSGAIEQDRFSNLGDGEDKLDRAKAQKADLFKQAFGTSYNLKSGVDETQELENQLKDLQGKFDQGTATQSDTEQLLKLISVKERLLDVNRQIEEEGKRQAEKEKELAAKRVENEANILALKYQAQGDDKGAQKAEEEQKRNKIFEEQKSLGYTPEQAMANANQLVDLEKAINELPKQQQRADNELDIEIKKAKASGDTEKAQSLEDEKKRKSLIKDQKSMGYNDTEASQNAEQIIALDKLLEKNTEKKDASPLAASSTMSVGGGGYSVGMGTGLLDENKKQTRLLETIAKAISSNKPSHKPQIHRVNLWESNS